MTYATNHVIQVNLDLSNGSKKKDLNKSDDQIKILPISEDLKLHHRWFSNQLKSESKNSSSKYFDKNVLCFKGISHITTKPEVCSNCSNSYEVVQKMWLDKFLQLSHYTNDDDAKLRLNKPEDPDIDLDQTFYDLNQPHNTNSSWQNHDFEL